MENFVKLNFHLGVFKTPFLNWNFYWNILYCFLFLFKDLRLSISYLYIFFTRFSQMKKKDCRSNFFSCQNVNFYYWPKKLSKNSPVFPVSFSMVRFIQSGHVAILYVLVGTKGFVLFVKNQKEIVLWWVVK